MTRKRTSDTFVREHVSEQEFGVIEMALGACTRVVSQKAYSLRSQSLKRWSAGTWSNLCVLCFEVARLVDRLYFCIRNRRLVVDVPFTVSHCTQLIVFTPTLLVYHQRRICCLMWQTTNYNAFTILSSLCGCHDRFSGLESLTCRIAAGISHVGVLLIVEFLSYLIVS